MVQLYESILQFAKPDKPVPVELVRKLTQKRPEYFAAALVALQKAGKIALSADRKLIYVIYERVE